MDTGNPLRQILADQGARERAFRERLRTKLELFSHMLGYGFVTPAYQRALARSGQPPEQELLLRVSLVLDARFHNATIGCLRMVAVGMWSEAFVLFRMAFEALQYNRLLAGDPSIANAFFSKPMRPVEVRKALEKAGHDLSSARDQYKVLSSWAHVGGEGLDDFDLSDTDAAIVTLGGVASQVREEEFLDNLISIHHLYQGFAIGIEEGHVAAYFEEARALLRGSVVTEESIDRLVALIAKYRKN